MNEEKSNSPLDQESEKISISSSKKWFWMGIVVALISPIAGLVLAITFWTEPGFKRQGRTILIFSIIWGIIFIFLTDWLVKQGYLPDYS